MKPISLMLPLAAAAALALSACGSDHSSGNKPPATPGDKPAAYAAEIRRTQYGVPHIKADNEGGIGFGVAWAYAQDNFCQFASEIVSVNAERAKFWGPDGASFDPRLNNLQSDFYFKLVNEPSAVESAWASQEARERATIEGYVAGYNAYLKQTGKGKLPAECRDADWVRPITVQDVIKVMRHFAVENGLNIFGPGLVSAAPPGTAAPAPAGGNALAPQALRALRVRTGSNGVALGADKTENGRGMLLSNPHFPWNGPLRFYQLHLSIPGKLDAMGVSLGGLPMVNIGFNKDLAWTHTNNTSAHFSLHQLQLDSSDPTRYIVDGKSQPMERRSVSVQVRQADGTLRSQSHDFYVTPFGVVATMPELFGWDRQTAFAVNDPNLNNHRLLKQWNAMNRATSLDEFKDAVDRIVGLPWVNTMAADKHGKTLYLDVTVVPKISDERQASCAVPGFEAYSERGIPFLVASTACLPDNDPGAPQPGIFAGASLPHLGRSDFVQNSNDSAWMTNPAAPLTGFPKVVSIEDYEQGGRTRIGLQQLQAGVKLSMARLQGMVMNDRVFYADLVMDDLLKLCATSSADLAEPCGQLASWDRTANLGANIGFGYFMALWDRIWDNKEIWNVPFDPADPLHTPRSLKVQDAGVAALLRSRLAEAVQAVRAEGWAPGALWGDVQGVQRGNRWLPVHGGSDHYGVYNAIESAPTGAGRRAVEEGTSYLQTVSFDDHGPVAQGLLTYGQSTDPASPYATDQTELFLAKRWVTLPFSEQQIASDPALTKTVVKSN
ncbi:MAG: acylase [Gammaproteobacteria bacterium]